MRIGCLQFAPQVGDVDNNLNRADSVLSKANLDDLDLLVLPELAFSGMNLSQRGAFQDARAISAALLVPLRFARRCCMALHNLGFGADIVKGTTSNHYRISLRF